MNVDLIRRAFARRPYRPLDLWLTSGDKVRIASPEVWISSVRISAWASAGQPLLIAPEEIAAIKTARRNGRTKARGGA